MKNKKCCTCKQFKTFSEFYRDRTISDGFARRCKDCQKEYIIQNIDKIKKKRKLYYQKNKEKKSKYYKEYYQKNRAKMVKRVMKWNEENPDKYQTNKRKYHLKHPEVQKKAIKKWYFKNGKAYYEKNREKILKYNAERRKNPKIRLDRNMATLMWYALKKQKMGKSWKTFVNYTLEDLVKHIEQRFEPWMNWNNYGKGSDKWEVDHIKPRALFHYTTPEDPQFKECWALSNLQPLSCPQNIKKGKKYINNK